MVIESKKNLVYLTVIVCSVSFMIRTCYSGRVRDLLKRELWSEQPQKYIKIERESGWAYVPTLLYYTWCMMTYFSLEHPQVTFFDKEYYSSVTMKSRRVSRNDPVHYVTVNYTSKKVMDNNFTLSLYFYQLLSNVYKRSFVDIHVKLCDLLLKDQIVGDAFRAGYYRVPEKERPMSVLKCPKPPGQYVYLNMQFRLTPLSDTFPFQEGRVYINVTDRGRITGRGYIDFALKTLRRSRK